ncbi:MAG: CvpA family protein, partial [Alphaproteobacteria bacterium]|nr:CvpA family protein [Alphaproteobacteria bacterium]
IYPDEMATIADIVGAGSIALIILVVCTLINAYITGKLRKSALSGLDRTLGFLFGLLRGVLLIVLVYFTASLALSEKEFDENKEKYAQKSITIPFIQKATHVFEKMLPSSLLEKIKEVSTEKEILSPEDIVVPSVPPSKTSVQEKTMKEENDTSYDDGERKDLNALILEIEE